MFKPNLIPNSSVEDPINLREIIGDRIGEYIVSYKKDGCRVEILDGKILSRELKPVKSQWIQEKYAKLAQVCKENDIVLEGEFYAHGMSFREICRFFKTEDVTGPKHLKSLESDCYKYNLEGTVDKPIWHKAKSISECFDLGKSGHVSKFNQDWPGRMPMWLCKNHEELKIWVFDIYFKNYPKLEYNRRLDWLFSHILDPKGILYEFRDILEIGEWFNLSEWNLSSGEITNFDTLEELYSSVLDDGWEGLVLAHKDRTYKMNRSTVKEATIFKMKEDKLQYDGVVLDIVEGTKVKEGVAKTTSNLGRSVTSKLAEDREPSGIASGILTEYNGYTHVVSPQGYSHEELKEMLENKEKYIGRWFHYTGMAPTKNCPRHAHFSRNPWRDGK